MVSKSPIGSGKIEMAPASTRSGPRQAIALISDYGTLSSGIGQEEAAGQSIYVQQVADALTRLGWQVDVFVRKTHANDPNVVNHSPYHRTICLAAGPEEFIHRDELFDYMPQFCEAFQKFQAKEGTNYPLVHTNYWLSGWVGMQLQASHNVQHVHTYHSIAAVKHREPMPLSPRAQHRLDIERKLLEQANCVVATSPQEQLTLETLVSTRGAIEMVPCGTDVSSFRVMPKAEARQQLGFAAKDQLVLYVGRFDTQKGIDTLVEAFSRLHHRRHIANLKLVLVGGSPSGAGQTSEMTRIHQLVKAFGLEKRVIFAGIVEHDLLPLYYTAADVCVIPSHYEPFGLVAIEAMACGTPVVASDVGGLRFTVVPEETGLLVPPQSVDGFAAAIDRVLSDDAWVGQLRKQAPMRVQENFSWTGVAVQLSDLYRRLLARSISQDFLWTPERPRWMESQPLRVEGSVAA